MIVVLVSIVIYKLPKIGYFCAPSGFTGYIPPECIGERSVLKKEGRCHTELCKGYYSCKVGPESGILNNIFFNIQSTVNYLKR